MDLHSYVLTLIKVKAAIPDVTDARNKEAVNVESELKLAVPVYLRHALDQVPEEHISELLLECERSFYFNFELIRGIKDTIARRKQADATR